jgi:hypothetical protein
MLTHTGHVVSYQQQVDGTPEDSEVFQQQPCVNIQQNKCLDSVSE